ncbi:hypothetical protein BV898_03332 [Hypsibius exemplaris]|uniref:Chitin-binding type-2 domain-containing protein n=1 Tax=Hypsibius exemplaris TaxID=2072580 RepID=A0A1W0X5Y7_HYPEX|nr:hypothetical protein BV898_03332 [Hypsibius exemplaris]
MCQRLIFLLPVASLCFSLTNAGISQVRAKRGANGDQTPQVWDALAALKGNTLTVKHIQDLYPNVVPGTDYPIFFEIPKRNIDCASFKQPGFYADVEVGRCQIFDRCDINGNLYSYLCPNMTLFNQITLVCDWWYNVDCSKERALYDYSNSRLFQKGLHLLDEQDQVAALLILAGTGAVKVSGPGAR